METGEPLLSHQVKRCVESAAEAGRSWPSPMARLNPFAKRDETPAGKVWGPRPSLDAPCCSLQAVPLALALWTRRGEDHSKTSGRLPAGPEQTLRDPEGLLRYSESAAQGVVLPHRDRHARAGRMETGRVQTTGAADRAEFSRGSSVALWRFAAGIGTVCDKPGSLCLPPPQKKKSKKQGSRTKGMAGEGRACSAPVNSS